MSTGVRSATLCFALVDDAKRSEPSAQNMVLPLAEVSGIGCGKALGVDEIAAVEAGMDRYAVLVFPDQKITGEQQVAFSERFGDLETPRKAYRTALTASKVSDVSNLDADNRVLPRGRDAGRRAARAVTAMRARGGRR